MWHITDLTSDLARSTAECHIACWREAYRGIVPDHLLDAFDVDQLAEVWKTRLNGPGRTHVAVSTSQETVIGFASAGPAPDTTRLELYSLYVRKSHYATGVADDLIRAAIGDEPCGLWVFEKNPRAQAFYRRHGFVFDGQWRTEAFSPAIEVRMVRTGPDIVKS